MASEKSTGSGLVGSQATSEAMPRGEVDDFQRARILSAMIEVSADVGYLGASVAPVVARAGVSRRTFYELFDGREDCFLAAFEWAVGQTRSVVLEAYGMQRTWRERVRYGLAALLVFFDAEPQLARVCVIEALGAGKLVLARRAIIVEKLAAGLGVEAPRARAGAGRPLLTAEGVVGGALSVIHGRLLEAQRVESAQAQGSGGLIGLHSQLMALIALPYLGPSAAGEEFSRSLPELPRRPLVEPRAHGDGGRLLERLEMRLTYRTVRCLVFVAEHPGASNREIAEGAEISDEGQASKLLARLTRLDLVANSRPHGPGFANRWSLTARGEQVLTAVRGR
ncbi:MAG: TetR/AcrR family transcriptional regulator [Solirubrobacteraceae bacterium]